MNAPNQVRLLLELHKLETNGNGVDKAEAYRRIADTLDPSLLKRYLRIRRKRDVGIAVLENCTCSGCRLMYPETHEFLRHKNFIRECEFCGRLLVVTN